MALQENKDPHLQVQAKIQKMVKKSKCLKLEGRKPTSLQVLHNKFENCMSS